MVSLKPDSVFRQKAVFFIPVSRSRCNLLQENSNRLYTLICLCIVWCLSQNVACSSAAHISALFCFPSDTMGVESWALWSYCLVLLLGVACYLLSGWLRAVCFVLQLPGPPVVPLLGNALLISNHQSEFRRPACLYSCNNSTQVPKCQKLGAPRCSAPVRCLLLSTSSNTSLHLNTVCMLQVYDDAISFMIMKHPIYVISAAHIQPFKDEK